MAVGHAEGDFGELCELIHRASGIKLDSGKKQLVRSRLRQRMLERGATSIGSYVHLLKTDTSGEETSRLVDLISTNVTSFFREPHHFDHLVKHVLGEHRTSGRVDALRVWSAACSSGQEPYSAAIALAEALGMERLRRFLILATDISTKMVSHAHEGIYSTSSLQSMRADLRAKWFQPLDAERSQLDWSLRGRVRARHLNLMDRWPMTKPFDVIFCRNALIYFDEPTVTRLAERFWQQLRPGGFLYIGHSESLAQIPNRFEYVAPTVYRRPDAEAGA